MYTENITISASIPLELIPDLWEQNEVLIFFIGLNNYDTLDTLSTEHLDCTEKEPLEKLQTNYFKKRYIVSRLALKHILCFLLKKQSVSDIATYKDEYGKIHIHDHQELHICISYTRSIVVLAISKVKLGIDIEPKRTLALRNPSKYMHKMPPCNTKSRNDLDFLKAWTLTEAYCKFSNKSFFSCLNKEPDLRNLFYSNYIVNNKYILAVITDPGSHPIHISCLPKLNFNKI